MSERFGIDVSHYQGDVDWKKVKAQGKEFAIMKCQYEGQYHRLDETFETNYRKCGIYGISRGVYIFIGRCSIAEPEMDAKSLLRHLGDRPLEYGIWLDYESDYLRAQGKKKIENLTYIYANAFRSAGYYVGIYCNKDWYERVISDKLKADYDFWIARYPKNDSGQYSAKSNLKPSAEIAVAWQYSSKGHVDGIKNYVDLDVDYDGIVNLLAESPYRKTNLEIANEVLEGKWGSKNSKPSREQLLTRAGYDYKTIQSLVNEWYNKKG